IDTAASSHECEREMKLRRSGGLAGLSAVIAGTALALVAGSMPAQAASSRPLQGGAQAFLNSPLVWNYTAAPAGANRSCTPSAAHPYPVILTEGTFASMYNS